MEGPIIVLMVVSDFRDILVASDKIILCIETDKYRYYYDLVAVHNFLFYYVFYTPLKDKKYEDWVTLGANDQITMSKVYKPGYVKISQVKWDSIASQVFKEKLK